MKKTFDTLGGSSYFSTIDVSAGFYQVPMDKDSQGYTAFRTPSSSFKWVRMRLGLTGNQNTFLSPKEMFFQDSHGKYLYVILMAVSFFQRCL